MGASRKRDLLFFGEYVALLLVALAWVQFDHVRAHVADRITTFYLVDAIAIAYVLLRGWLVLKLRLGGVWDHLFLAADLAVISAFVNLTGGIHSDAGLVYLWPLATATASHRPPRTLGVSIAIGVAYCLAVWPTIEGPVDTQRLLLRLFLLVLVATLAYAYTRAEATRAREIARLREQVVVADSRTRLQHEVQDAIQQRLQEVDARLEEVAELAQTRPDDAREAVALLRQDVGEIAGELRELIRSDEEDDQDQPA